jgi:hypothetical protein
MEDKHLALNVPSGLPWESATGSSIYRDDWKSSRAPLAHAL